MAIARTKTISPSWLRCILLVSVLSAPSVVRGTVSSKRLIFWSPKSNTAATGFGILRQQSNDDFHNLLLNSMRGGSSEEVEEEEDASEEEEDVDGEKEEDSEKVPAIATNEPVRLIISTNWGNSVIDQTVELTPARTRDVASLKKSLSKQLQGRPPIVSIDLVFEGRVLEDDTLVDELFEDEDEEEEDEEDIEEGNEPTRRLTLNLVPPVDPKFATELAPKLVYRSEDDDDFNAGDVVGDIESISTDELVDAYYMNQVAMARNAQLLADPNSPSSPFLRMESQEQAKELRQQLQSETPVDVWEKCMKVPDEKSVGTTWEEWRGQRYRSTKGGVSRQLKTAIQTNMNVDWGATIQYCLLFLFLGYFGGRQSWSRQLLYWGAPLSFALQARPVKILWKTIFYLLTNPPSILLSFMPAPQQAILSVDLEASCIALYGEDGAKTILGGLSSEAVGSKSTAESTIFEEEEESNAEETEEEEDEYDSEEEDSDDVSDDDDDDSDDE